MHVPIITDRAVFSYREIFKYICAYFATPCCRGTVSFETVENSQYTPLFNIKEQRGKFAKNFHTSWNFAARRAALQKFRIITNTSVHLFYFTAHNTKFSWIHEAGCVMWIQKNLIFYCKGSHCLLYYITAWYASSSSLYIFTFVHLQSEHMRWICCGGLYKVKGETSSVNTFNTSKECVQRCFSLNYAF